MVLVHVDFVPKFWKILGKLIFVLHPDELVHYYVFAYFLKILLNIMPHSNYHSVALLILPQFL